MFFFYYFFFFTGLACATFVIFSRNTIHSILFLILLFCNVVGLLFLLNVEYLAMVFIIVYIGAIAVLFLFVVMMLNLWLLDVSDFSWRYLPLGIVICSIFIFEVLAVYYNYYTVTKESSRTLLELLPGQGDISQNNLYFQDNYVNWIKLVENTDNIHVLGQVMYTYYVIAFLLSGVILFISMVGAIVLTLPDQVVYKRQLIFKQIGRKVELSLLK